MAKLIPATERITRAKVLIQKAREVPVPAETGRFDLTYVASVKDLLRQARDLIKFIPYSPSSSKEMKAEVTELLAEADRLEKGIFQS